jgi:hypothetical protein
MGLGIISSIWELNELVVNWIRDLPAWPVLPPPTALPRGDMPSTISRNICVVLSSRSTAARARRIWYFLQQVPLGDHGSPCLCGRFDGFMHDHPQAFQVISSLGKAIYLLLSAASDVGGALEGIRRAWELLGPSFLLEEQKTKGMQLSPRLTAMCVSHLAR